MTESTILKRESNFSSESMNGLYASRLKQAKISEASYAFSVSLDFFSGPLDLLLHLVHQQEVSVEKVKMSVIAEQYLDIVLKASNFLDLEKASEYLVIAATLLSIKSSSLLPKLEEASSELDDNWVDTRFFEDLRERLKVFEQTKKQAQALINLPQLGVDTFNRVDRKALLPTPEMLAEPEDAQSLGKMFGSLLKRIGFNSGGLRIGVSSISVVSYMMRIVDIITVPTKNISSMCFSSLLKKFYEQGQSESKEGKVINSKGIVIGSFVAVLELVKRGLLSVKQDEESADIELMPKLSLVEGISITESEFDNIETAEKEGILIDKKIVSLDSYRKQNMLLEEEETVDASVEETAYEPRLAVAGEKH